jgi:hypothetical protein
MLDCECGGPFRQREIRLRCIRRSPRRANSGDKRIRRRCRAAVVNDWACTHRGQGFSRGATDAARGSRDKRRFVGKTSHDCISMNYCSANHRVMFSTESP